MQIKFLNNLSENKLRYVFIIIAFFYLTLNLISFYNNVISKRMTTDDCLWEPVNTTQIYDSLYITQIIKDGVADKAGLQENDILILINGFKFNNSTSAMDILNKYSNENITYTIIRNNQVYNVSIWVYKYLNILFLIFWSLGLVFLLVGLMVGYSKPKELTSRLFFFLSCFTSIGLILYSGTYPLAFMITPDYPILIRILLNGINIFFGLNMIILPAIFLHFFLTYPIKYNFKHRGKIIFFSYIILFSYSIIRFAISIIQNTYALNLNALLGAGIFLIYLLIGLILFNKSSRKISDPVLKKSLKIINRGFLIGGMGALYYAVFIMQKPIFLVKPILILPCSLVFAIPLSFGFSIFKYRILDTELVVKKGLIFGIVSAIIVIIYLATIYFLDSFLKDYIQGNNNYITIGFILFFTITFDYVNKKAKEFVDSQFYRERYNYRKSLLVFSQDISYINNINELLERICESVKQTMNISELNIWLYDKRYFEMLENDTLCKNFKNFGNAIDTALFKLFIRNKTAVQFNTSNYKDFNFTQEEIDEIVKHKIALSIPIILKDKLIGALNFGSKPSGKAYSDEDIDLLKTFASQSAFCFENSRLKIEEINKQKIDEELIIARNIQNSLLPNEDIKFEGLEISGYSEPAKTIGGDFYDLIKIDEKKILVIIADVSGKGIPAALYMSKVQAMIQFASQMFKSPREILIEANQQIYEQIDRKSFITMIIALFDLDKMTVKYARAGHNPALLINDDRKEIITSKGLGLGLDSTTVFNQYLEEKEIPIKKGDLFLFYSDGLNEAMNKSRNEFGLKNVMEILSENKNGTTSEIQNIILNNVSEFRGDAEQNDDITFVTLKIK